MTEMEKAQLNEKAMIACDALKAWVCQFVPLPAELADQWKENMLSELVSIEDDLDAVSDLLHWGASGIGQGIGA